MAYITLEEVGIMGARFLKDTVNVDLFEEELKRFLISKDVEEDDIAIRFLFNTASRSSRPHIKVSFETDNLNLIAPDVCRFLKRSIEHDLDVTRVYVGNAIPELVQELKAMFTGITRNWAESRKG